MADTQTTQSRLSQQQVYRALLFARSVYPNDFLRLAKNVELGANGVWLPEDEQFQKVFDEWYAQCKNTLGKDFVSFVEGQTPPPENAETGVQSSVPDKELLLSLQQEAEELMEVAGARRALIEERTRLYIEDLKRRVPRVLDQQEINTLQTKVTEAFSKGKRPAINEFLESEQQHNIEPLGIEFEQKSSKDNRVISAVIRESVTREYGGARPTTLFSLYRHRAETENNVPIKSASRDSRLIDGFSSEEGGDENDLPLFRALAEHEGSTIREKVVSRVLDTIAGGMEPKEREAVHQNVVVRALKNAAENTQALTDRVGSEAASSISNNLKTHLASSEGISPVSRIGKAVSDVGSSVFGRQAQDDVASLIALENNVGALLGPDGSRLFKSSFVETPAGAGTQTTVLVNNVFVSGKVNAGVIDRAIVHSRLPFRFPVSVIDKKRVVVSILKRMGVVTTAEKQVAGGFFGKILVFFGLRTETIVVNAGGKAAGGFLGRFLASLGIKIGARAAGASAGSAAGAAGGAAAGAAGGTAAGATAATAAGAGAGSAGGPPGAVIGAIVGAIIVPVWNGIKKIVGGLLSAKAIPVIGQGIGAVSSYFGNGLPPAKKDSMWLILLVLILAPILLVMGSTMFQTTSYRGSALIAPPGNTNRGEDEQSKYIRVTLSAQPNVIANANIPATIVYTITITATSDNLTNLSVSRSLSLVTATGVQSLTPSPLSPPPKTTLAAGESMTLTFTGPANTPDSIIVATAIVSADVPGQSVVGAVSTANASVRVGNPSFGSAFSCMGGGNEITAAGSVLNLLPVDTGYCIVPTMIVVHWSGGHANSLGDEATFNTLVSSNLACQFASDTSKTWQMQKLWEDKAMLGWCAGGSYNNMALNNEIAGVYFDNPWNPGDQSGHPPDSEINRAVDNICWMMKQYKIPVSQVVGHCQISPYKCGLSGRAWDDEPGPEFLRMIRSRVAGCR